MTLAQPSAIVVLGHQNDEHGKLSDIAMQRCQQAFSLYQSAPLNLICTGASGASFNPTDVPHAEHLQTALLDMGVHHSHFLPQTLSHNTYEDAKLTTQTVEKYNLHKLFLVTSDFHLHRAFLWFKLFAAHTPIIPCAAKTETNAMHHAKLLAHETQAIKNFYRDFPDFPEVTSFSDWSSS